MKEASLLRIHSWFVSLEAAIRIRDLVRQWIGINNAILGHRRDV
ncbi:hypothetical protein FHS27_005082 [Rhodopirellula rubra]|uniref:Uncharacterized protein n=1 Tax=Aporhodopirellula rubra TaxID=980271 RepID=A0A7W5H8B0_9BACT|nr:hypothetical protein [Aporhodopirellula rubra]MBB3209244.1 hypothetical protein [Aporhodopirellula rubra]